MGSPKHSPLRRAREAGALVNDVHSQLNATRVAAIVKPRDVDELAGDRRDAHGATGTSVSIAGGRHAMGGQQFGEASVLVDTRALDRVLAFDAERGLVTVEGGIQWPALIGLSERDRRARPAVGNLPEADRRRPAQPRRRAGLQRPRARPDAEADRRAGESFDLIGRRRRGAARARARENADLFRLAIGGYGLFGVIARVSCGCARASRSAASSSSARRPTSSSASRSASATAFSTATTSSRPTPTRDSFLRRGVFSCYQPVPPDTPLTAEPDAVQPGGLGALTFYSHTQQAPRLRGLFARATWRRPARSTGPTRSSRPPTSTTITPTSTARLGATRPGTEMITEIYVAARRGWRRSWRTRATTLRAAPGQRHLRHGPPDRERRRDVPGVGARALRVRHLQPARRPHAGRRSSAAADAFRALIDLGIAHGGSYYLTYHRWARRDQVERCYPQMREFLALKRRVRSRRGVPEQLVPPLPRHVRGVRMRDDRMACSTPRASCSGLQRACCCASSASWSSCCARRRGCRRWSSGSRACAVLVLLVGQAVVLGLMFWISIDFCARLRVLGRAVPRLGRM